MLDVRFGWKADIGDGPKQSLGDWLAFSNGVAQLRAEFRTVLVSMHLNRVLSCGIDEFIFAIGGDRDRAVGFAGELPAINIFAAHVSLPDVVSNHTPNSFAVLQPGR